MAHKRSTTSAIATSSEASGQQAADANGAQQAEKDQGGTEKSQQGTKASLSRREAVQEALRKGIDSPTKIAEYAKNEYGLDITTNHVSTIKSGLTKSGKAGKQKAKPDRKPKASAPAPASAPPTKPTTPAFQSVGLAPADLAALADLTRRAGGFDELQQYLDVLNGLR